MITIQSKRCEKIWFATVYFTVEPECVALTSAWPLSRVEQFLQSGNEVEVTFPSGPVEFAASIMGIAREMVLRVKSVTVEGTECEPMAIVYLVNK